VISVKDDLTVSDILNTKAGFDHVVEVRSIAPALTLVLEKDAPFRMELLASTESEHQALRDECRSNHRWREILEAWFACKDNEDDMDFRREDKHAGRLAAGERISTVRVTDHGGRP
jgi:hypothetical protein